jgi:predicted ATP-binding protein involved in virulence
MGGIVLVDEIDLLLHPSWQRVVIPAVARTFPNIQFIFTTHSPIVTGTLEAENILVARETDVNGISIVRHVEAEVHGLNAEQVLLSSYFELSSTRSPDISAGIEELARLAIDGDEEARRRYLTALIEGLPGDLRK